MSTRQFDNHSAKDKIISLGYKRSIETNVSKEAVFTMLKVFAQFSSYYRVWQNSRNTLLGSTSYCDNYWRFYKNIFQDLRYCWKQKFWTKKGRLSSDEKILAPFFSFYPTWQMSRNYFLGFTRFFDICCAIDKIIPSRPKRSTETNISKKSCFHDVKRVFGPFFLALPSVTILKEHFIRVHKLLWQLLKNL